MNFSDCLQMLDFDRGLLWQSIQNGSIDGLDLFPIIFHRDLLEVGLGLVVP